MLNMRNYPGSTPYSAEELESLEGRPGAPEAMLQARGAEVAEFIRWFIETEDIPPIHERADDHALVGGISLLSWSGGNLPTISMLAHAGELPEQTCTVLETYYRSFIMFGAPCRNSCTT